MSWQAPFARRAPDSGWLLDGGFRLRAACHEDLDQICATETDAYAFPWTRGHFSDSLHSHYDFWVLLEDVSPVGHAVLMWSPGEVHLLNITVRPGRQGQGLGRRFLGWLLDDAALRGAGNMYLEVRQSNVGARGLYESMNFVRIGLRKGYYPSWNNSREDALVFSRQLASQAS